VAESHTIAQWGQGDRVSVPEVVVAAMWLVISPMPSTRLVSVCPGVSQRGGFMVAPIPDGVPVKIRSPGISGRIAESLAMICGTEMRRCDVHQRRCPQFGRTPKERKGFRAVDCYVYWRYWVGVTPTRSLNVVAKWLGVEKPTAALISVIVKLVVVSSVRAREIR